MYCKDADAGGAITQIHDKVDYILMIHKVETEARHKAESDAWYKAVAEAEAQAHAEAQAQFIMKKLAEVP